MPVNQLLASSLTSLFLANPANLPPPVPSATHSEKFGWIDSAHSGSPPEGATQVRVEKGDQPAWTKQLSANVKGVSSLQAGWDGPGSVPIFREILSRAMFYIESALKAATDDVAAPRLVPGGDGSLQIEWHTRRGELEFDLGTDGEMSIWVRDHASGAEFDGEGEEAFALFYRWASWVASRPRHAIHVPETAPVAFFEIAA